jgi:hypothetical protein
MLLDLCHTLPPSLFLPSVGISCPIGQAREFCLIHDLGLARIRQLIHEKGDLSNHLVGLPVSRSQQGGTLPDPLLSLGGQGLHLLDGSHGSLLRRSGLQGCGYHCMNHRSTGGLRNNSSRPHSGDLLF